MTGKTLADKYYVLSHALSNVVILDGGFGTELERRGYDTTGGLWTARVLNEHPDAVEQLHYDYYAAGAECVITASYQITYEGFEQQGFTRDDATAALLKSVELARRARDRIAAENSSGKRRYIAASVGPYGARLEDGSEYHGNYAASVAEIAEFHDERFGVLAESGADVLACETIPIFDEARALLDVVRNHPDVEAWFTFTTPDGVHTSHGERLSDAVRLVDNQPNIVAVGVNCLRPLHVSTALREMKSATGKPLVAYPNSGERWNPVTWGWDGAPDEERLATLAPGWIDGGARLIGGCCRTGPADIASLAQKLALIDNSSRPLQNR
jgi:homocysteine S-methyltransferase